MKSKKGKRKVFKGETVSGGIAIGEAALFGTRRIPFPKYWINEGEVKGEVKRFAKSLQACREALGQIKSKLCRIQGREQITILDS
ncbi:MAG: phosphoenolpyruvate-utilizing N-terminal domain-containing protein, partial [Deltaproteobacteria bacterium]|nr:phosphoenolpyruvate-utilizing N-terminal domain-containing protein [Deltaproteobacteria bacterium]